MEKARKKVTPLSVERGVEGGKERERK